MGLFSANRFKNLCPEYVQEALDLAKQDQNKQPEAPVAQSETPGKEGADDPKPTESHIKQETTDESQPIDVSLAATDDANGTVDIQVTSNEDIPGRKVQEAADVSDTEEISVVDEAAYLDYLLESLDSDF